MAELNQFFPGSMIGKPVYIGLLTDRAGTELRIGKRRPAYSPVAAIPGNAVCNIGRIIFEEFKAEAWREYRVTHIALYDDPFCGMPFAAARLTEPMAVRTDMVVLFDSGQLTFGIDPYN